MTPTGNAPGKLGRKRVAALAAVVVALPVAAAMPVTAHAGPRMPTHVACVGDSITQGVGVAMPMVDSYPVKLQGLLGSGTQVRNFGHSGATLLTTGDSPYQRTAEYTAATTFVDGAGAGAIVDVIIMLGTNDSKPNNWMPAAVDGGTRADQFETDLAAMVDHFANLASRPVVYLALPLDALTNSYTISGAVIHDQILPIIQRVAADKMLPTIDVNTPTTGQASYFTDGVHPNVGGYVVVAGVMRDGLLSVPTVSITDPTDGWMLRGPATVTVQVLATDPYPVQIASVEVFANGTSLGQATPAAAMAGHYTLDWANVIPGAYALTATATDAVTASATSDPPVQITLTPSTPDDTRGSSKGCGDCSVGGRVGGAFGSALLAAAVALLVTRQRTSAGRLGRGG